MLNHSLSTGSIILPICIDLISTPSNNSKVWMSLNESWNLVSKGCIIVGVQESRVRDRRFILYEAP